MLESGLFRSPLSGSISLNEMSCKRRRFHQRIVVGDRSGLARLARVSQPRLTRLLNLLHLAPGIPEAMLFLPRVTEGKDPIASGNLRGVVAEVSSGGAGPDRTRTEITVVPQQAS